MAQTHLPNYSVTPLSAPSGQLMYLDYTYSDSTPRTKGKRTKRSKMQRFKIKYTNTKGQLKTRNIKATSEARAMSEIKDMGQHHYTIVESIDDEPAASLEKKTAEKWQPILESMVMDSQKADWLAKYMAIHKTLSEEKRKISDGYDGINLSFSSVFIVANTLVAIGIKKVKDSWAEGSYDGSDNNITPPSDSYNGL